MAQVIKDNSQINVVKCPPSYAFADLRNEYNIYARLAENGGSDRITHCIRMVERGIELEYLERGYLTFDLKGLQYHDEDFSPFTSLTATHSRQTFLYLPGFATLIYLCEAC